MSTPGASLGGRTYLRLVLLGAAIGIPAALVAAGFMARVHESEDLLWDELPDALGRPAAAVPGRRSTHGRRRNSGSHPRLPAG